tara:strand:- start:336 stop:473 length:138 start_codon:yes stop_codon:yes gene_type:complete
MSVVIINKLADQMIQMLLSEYDELASSFTLNEIVAMFPILGQCFV